VYSQEALLEPDFKASYKLILSGVEVGVADVSVTRVRNGYQLSNNLIFRENELQVTVNGVTRFNDDKNLTSYQKTTSRSGRRDVTRINFSGNQALLQGGETEVTVTIPGRRILMDNYSVVDLISFASALTPTMEKEKGKLFVTSRMMLVDYEVESAGPARYTLNGKVVQCDLYKMKIADRIEAEFYKQGDTLIAYLQKPDYTAFEIVR
jgi:hypothetical protein